MTRTIAEHWRGNLAPIEYLGLNSSEMKQLENLMHRHIEMLEEMLTEKEKTVYEKYRDCVDDYVFAVAEQAFCDGFCLGVRIMAEALCGTTVG